MLGQNPPIIRLLQIAALCARKMEYLEPTKNSNIKLLILVVVVVMIGPALNYLWSIFLSWTDSLPLCDSIIWLERGIYFIGLTFILLSIWWLKTSYLVFRYRQYPYPGATVYIRTKIRKGKAAYFFAFVFTIYGFGYYWCWHSNCIRIRIIKRLRGTGMHLVLYQFKSLVLNRRNAHNNAMLLKGKCWAKTRPSFAFSKLRR